MRWISNPDTGLWQVPRRVEIARSIRAGMPEIASVDLDGFRWRDDDGDESSTGATFLAAENVNYTAIGADVSDRIIRLRILLEQDNAAHDQSEWTAGRLEAKLNSGGSWAEVPLTTAGTYVEMTPSQLVSAADTTDHGLTKSGGYDHNSDPGSQQEVGATSSAKTWDNTDSGNTAPTSMFFEWSVKLLASGLSDGDVIFFRVSNNGTLLSTYTFGDASDTNPITVTVEAAPVGDPEWDQDSFRLRFDNGSESAADWIAVANANANLTPEVGYRVRFLIQETAGFAPSPDPPFRLYYNLNSGGWTEVGGGSSVVKSYLSDNLTDQEATTEQMGGAGTFVPGEVSEYGVTGAIPNLIALSDTEVEYTFYIEDGDVSDGDTLELRVVLWDGTPLDTYTNSISFTIRDYDWNQRSFRFRNDDDDEINATWRQLVNVDDTLETDTNYRIRFMLELDDGIRNSGPRAYLQYNHEGGGWNQVTGASSVIKLVTSIEFTDGDPTTQQLGSGTFVGTDNRGMLDAGGVYAGKDPNDGTATSEWLPDYETEYEICFQVKSADVSQSDTIELRLVEQRVPTNGNDYTSVGSPWPFTTYTQTPTITVAGGGTPSEIFEAASVRTKVPSESQEGASVRVTIPAEIFETASARVALPSEIFETSSVRVVLASESFEDVSVRTKIRSEIFEATSFRVAALLAETQEDASIRVELQSEIFEAGSIRAEVPSEIFEAGSVQVVLAAETFETASVRVALAAEIFETSSVQVVLAAEIFEAGSVQVVLASEIQVATSFRVAALSGEIFEASSVRAEIQSEIQEDASVQSKVLSESQEDASVQVVLAGESQEDVSVRTEVPSEISEAAYIRAGVLSEISETSSVRTKIQSEIFETSSVRVVLAAEIFESGSIRAKVNSEIFETASFRATGLDASEIQEASSVRVEIPAEIFEAASIQTVLAAEIFETSSVRVVLASEIFETSSVRVALAGQLFENASARVALSSQAIADGSLQAEVPSEIFETASVQVVLASEIFETASIRAVLAAEIYEVTSFDVSTVAIPSEIQEAASARAKVHSEIFDAVSVRTALWGEQFKAASIRTALQSEIFGSASLRAALASELQESVLLQVTLRSALFSNASLQVSGNSETQSVSSLRVLIVEPDFGRGPTRAGGLSSTTEGLNPGNAARIFTRTESTDSRTEAD